MSNSRTLDRALQDVLKDIRSGLADKIKKAVIAEVDNIRKAKGLNKLIQKREELQNVKQSILDRYHRDTKEIENKLYDMEREIDKLDGTNNDEKAEEDVYTVLVLSDCNYRTTKSQIQAAKKISKTIEARNYFNFKQIEKNTLMMYDLAVTAKEKRSIIISIQSRNWRDLGIDIPQLPFFEKFEIEKGQITVPTQPLIEGSKK